MSYNKENNKIPSNSLLIRVQKFILAWIVLLTTSKSLLAQYNVDSIKTLSYKDFENYFKKKQIDTTLDLIYANVFLEKARRDKDTIKIADAYHKISSRVKNYEALKYADSIISLTKSLQGNKRYPILGYIVKGVIYDELGELQKSIEQYLKAQEVAEKNKSNLYLAIIKYNIGVIKTYLGDYKEALNIFRADFEYIKDCELSNKNYQYTFSMFALADAYVRNNKLDSATLLINEGLKLCLKNNYLDLYSEYLFLSGITLYHTENYQPSIDSISKSFKVHDLGTNTPFAHLYLGKSNLASGNSIEALSYFIKVDSFLSSTKFIAYELLEVYPPIIDYYKKKGDYAKQLFYTNQLLKYDSIFDTNKSMATKNIAKNYEIPLLLASKDKLIDKLNSNNKNMLAWGICLIVTLLLSLFGVVSFHKKRNRRHKRNFDRLIAELNEKETTESSNDKKQPVEKTFVENPEASLNDRLVNSILKKLEKFETSKRFANRSYTQEKLARELNTNSTYLSKVINDSKGQNFSNYLKNLRIDYAIERLKNEPKFRTYTIQTIAEEVGFNKAQTFSTAFHKKTGIYPSSFIKQLEKLKKFELSQDKLG